MHARLARYILSGDAQELTRKAEDGILPTFKSMPGFKAYSVIESDGELISFSAWETAEQAEAANIAVADWVAENIGSEIQLIESRFGEVLLSTTLGVSSTTGARV
jgi:N-acetylglutamate synthase-like GNAT family acetyltransferase